MKLSEVTERQFESERRAGIEGIILDSPFDRGDIIVMVPCFCVHDTESSPCPCMYDWKIYIDEKDLVRDIERLERESRDGERLSRATVDRNARVLVEHSTLVSAEEAGRLAEYAESAPDMTSIRPPWPPHIWPFPFPWPFPLPDGEPPIPNGEEDFVYFWPIAGPIIAAVGGAIAGAVTTWAISDSKECETTSTTRAEYDERGRPVMITETKTVCK